MALEVAAEEIGGGGLLHNDVDDVLTVEVAGLPQERLGFVIVVLGLVLEVPVEPAQG